MSQYNTVADEATITTTAKALESNGFTVTIAEDAAAAKAMVLEKLPKDAEVLTVTSQTLEKIGLVTAINDSGEYDSVREKLIAMGNENKSEQRKLSAAPDFVVGSVQAITQEGHAFLASATGSQLPAYTYGAGHVIWVVGAQKIVKDTADAWQRLKQHILPLEDVRSQKAYGVGTSPNKVVIFDREAAPGRVEIVLVKEALGF
ncbi:MAG TPA: LUD domain-containing protein [Patescibacteria group bacterium]|nr:LUD domain-containing protein [Patescibacteria group bacterium]